MFVAELDAGHLDALFVCETWLCSEVSSAFLCGPSASSYQVFRKDREADLGNGGGVALFVRSSLSPRPLPFEPKSELSGCDLEMDGVPIRLLVAYRPPSGTIANQLLYLKGLAIDLKRASSDTTQLVLAGDMNLADIEWTESNASSPLARDFLSLALELGLSQHVLDPTRRANILDLILSHPRELVFAVSVSPCFLPSDHHQVDFSVSVPPSKRGICPRKDGRAKKAQSPAPGRVRRNWKRADYGGMREFLRSVDFDYILSIEFDVSAVLSFLVLICHDLIERFVPPAPRLTPKSALPPRLHALRKLRFSLLRSRNCHLERFKAVDRRYRRSLCRFFEARERAVIFGSHDGLTAWMKLNNVSPSRRSVDIRLNDGTFVSDPFEKAQLFLAKFSEDFNTDNGTPLGLLPCDPPHFAAPMITEALVAGTATKMVGKLSCGPDGIPVRLLKRVGDLLAAPLAEIFKRMMTSVECPAGFLPVLTVPIPKAGKRLDCIHSYRPISLSSAFARLYERILNRQLMAFLLEHDKIPRSQFGFMPGHSCTSQLIEYTDEIAKITATGVHCYAVMLDIKGAFLAPPPSKLVESLAWAGVAPPVLLWLKEYLSCRSFSVLCDGKSSDSAPVISGGVQGSSLSCTAFLCYLAPVLKGLQAFEPEVTTFVFADDFKLVSANPEKLQIALDFLVSEFDRRQLSLSLHKCLAIRFLPPSRAAPPPPNGLPEILIHGTPLAYADEKGSTRDLGVLIDARLKFSHHIRHVVSRARFVSGRILRTYRSRCVDVLSRAFQVYVSPIIDYASSLWAGGPKTELSHLENVLRWFSRRVFLRCHIRMVPYEDRLDAMKLVSVSNRLLMNDLGFAHSVYHGRHRCEALSVSQPTHDYPLSHPHLMSFERRRKGPRLNCAANRIPAKWNRLSYPVVRLKKKAFKTRIKSLTISGFYAS